MQGELQLIYGPMFSGKTDELITRFVSAAEKGSTTIAFKPARDTRYAPDRIVSHSGREISATAVASADELSQIARGAEFIVIDEVQFFDSRLRDDVASLRSRGAGVIAAGLDLDFRREPFETTSLLMADASSRSRLDATCSRCGKPASLTQRLLNGEPVALDSPRFVVGDAEIYEPRCESCWTAERTV